MELSAIEPRLLYQLNGEPTRVFTREELMRDVWGYRLVINVWGVGFRLIDG